MSCDTDSVLSDPEKISARPYGQGEAADIPSIHPVQVTLISSLAKQLSTLNNILWPDVLFIWNSYHQSL